LWGSPIWAILKFVTALEETTMENGFDARAYVPRDLYDAITDIRVRQPGFADGEADRRTRRRVAAPDGKLVILAADHPGRASLRIQDDPLAMADRHEVLARIVRVLSHAGIDGVMSTPDVVEDLLILGGLLRARGGQNPLDERLLIGCMNRGGLPGTVWEMDDSFGAFTTRRMVILGLDGGKFMVRIDPTDRGSHATLQGCARAVTELAEANLLAFLEPLPVIRENGVYKVIRTPRALAEAVSVASAVGASSLYTWLKLPTCPDFEQVARATTLPLVVLGGEAVGDPRPVIEDLRRGMGAGSNVRGAMIGRNVLYPGGDDPRAVAAAVAAVIHHGAGMDEALAAMDAERGKDPELV
jgi:DhnA family fructose-bisphosphate aldolase class Ia